ncbi:MAG TPA: tripartite tricarboxylate transporter TctB family protein [Malonomonas sp.]
MSERIVAVFLLILSAAFGIQAWTYVPEGFTDVLGARAFPLTVALCMVPLAAILFFEKNAAKAWPSRQAWRVVFIALAALVVYGLVINFLGFFVATTGIFIVYGTLYRARLWKTVLVGVLASLTLYALFVWVLDMYLPVGQLFERIF